MPGGVGPSGVGNPGDVNAAVAAQKKAGTSLNPPLNPALSSAASSVSGAVSGLNPFASLGSIQPTLVEAGWLMVGLMLFALGVYILVANTSTMASIRGAVTKGLAVGA